MSEPAHDRVWLSKALLGCGAAVCLGSFGLAQVGLAWQREHWGQGYWMIPVNLPLFYFVPVFSVAAFTVASMAGRRSKWLAVALVGAVLYTSGRVAFWAEVARALGGHPSPEEFEAARAERLAQSLAVSSSGLLTWIALVLGLYGSLRERWMPRPFEEPRSSSAG